MLATAAAVTTDRATRVAAGCTTAALATQAAEDLLQQTTAARSAGGTGITARGGAADRYRDLLADNRGNANRYGVRLANLAALGNLDGLFVALFTASRVANRLLKAKRAEAQLQEALGNKKSRTSRKTGMDGPRLSTS